MPPKSINIEQLQCNTLPKEGKQFDMVRSEHFLPGSKGMEQAHRHNYYMVFLPTAGEGRHLVDFQSHLIRPGRVFLMYPGQIHAWESFGDDLLGFLLFFTQEFFYLRYHNNLLLEFPFFRTTCRKPYVDLCDEEMQQLTRVCECMEDELRRKDKDYLKALRSFLNVLLIRVSRHYVDAYTKSVSGPEKNAAQIVHQFEQLIDQHFVAKHRVKDYAKMLLISPNYLNAVCNRILGKSAGELIRERIMLEAKRLLLHDAQTVSEIGHQLHFEDNSYFCRFFKKYAGTSPERFRRKYRDQ